MNDIVPVKLSQYNLQWPVVFNNEKEKILSIIGGGKISVEHIGSTAILGAVAKPEIDIMIGIDNLGNARDYILLLESLGYVYFQKFEEFVPERRYLRKSKGIVPLFHIHMVETASEFWKDHILFRDYLSTHPEVVEKYNKLKQDLIAQFNGDRKNYSKGKEKFITDVLKIARMV